MLHPDKEEESLIGLDGNMQMSFFAGLLDNLQGAAFTYLNNQPDPKKATCTIVCQAKSREEKLDLLSLVNYEVPHVVFEENRRFFEAISTHVVSSVFYGTEVYCVLAEDVDETDQERRNAIVENLSKLASKFIEGLNHFQNLSDFKKLFTQQEKHSITRVKCRLYADLQPTIDCSFFDAYNQTLDLMNQILTAPKQMAETKSVPISIRLCPLNILLDRGATRITYRKASLRLASRCSSVFNTFKRVLVVAEKMSATNRGSACRDSIFEFLRLVSEYQESFQEDLKLSLVCDRQRNNYSCTELMVRESQKKNCLFKSTRLEQWISLKRNELLVMDWMDKAAGKWITFLANKNQLEEHLAHKKFAAVLVVPPLDQQTNSILAAMKKFIDETELPKRQANEDLWRSNSLEHKLVLDKISELATHAEKNEEMANQVAFFVIFGERSKPFGCSYSVYQSGQLLKDKIGQLPDPPTGLKISLPPAPRTAKRAKLSLSPFRVSWDYEDLGYPCNFLVEYRIKGEF